MKIPVLVEMLGGKGFRARAGDPFNLEAEGKTQPEALEKLRKLIDERQKSGAWIVYLDFPNIDNPRHELKGTLDPDDPNVQAWMKEMAEHRKERDKQLDAL
jgi:hypothetical protein